MPEYDAVHSQSPETYLFLGVQIKILLSHRQTGGQFTLAEGIVPPAATEAYMCTTAKTKRCTCSKALWR